MGPGVARGETLVEIDMAAKVKRGIDNRRHLYRHAVRALEDFQRLSQGYSDDRWWPHEIEERMHAISHHLRHVVYRAGIEASWWMP
jgi:hypothetical protein